MQSLQHDVAMEIAAVFAPGATDEQLRDLFEKLYDALMAALRRYEERAERRVRRVHPR